MTSLNKIYSLMAKLDPNFGFLMESKQLINEDQASKSIDAAKQLYMQRTGKSKEDADYFVRVTLRNDLPSLRDKNGGKFILGVTRMALDGQLRDERTISNLNKTIKLIATGHLNEYDRNLNDESADAIIQRFSGAMKAMDGKDREEVGQGQYTENKRYTVVPINSFEEAEEYSAYTSWCVTHDEHIFDSYTSGGIGQFYFCLRNDYQTVPKEFGEGCPLDDYGLSMVAVSVDENGSLHTCTCRWNHDNGGNDNIMDTKQISQLIGRNFYEVFKPNNKWKVVIDNALARLQNGESPKDVFDDCWVLRNGFAVVRLNAKYNIINTDGKLISEQWWDCCYDFQDGYARVKLNGKWNLIDTKGKYLSEQWFDGCYSFQEGYARVKLNGKWNFIDTKGKYLSEQWFDGCCDFHDGCAAVWLNGKRNFIDTKGNLISEQWFDDCDYSFQDGYARVKLNGKYNYIDTKGKYLSEQWFDSCYSFQDGYANVNLDGKWYKINTEGQIV